MALTEVVTCGSEIWTLTKQEQEIPRHLEERS